MLRVKQFLHKNGLEEHVADEELQTDASDAPEIRCLIPCHAQQHLRCTILTRVDDAVAPFSGVRGAAEVDECDMATLRQPHALFAMIPPLCVRDGNETHAARRLPR